MIKTHRKYKQLKIVLSSHDGQCTVKHDFDLRAHSHQHQWCHLPEWNYYLD